MSDRSKHVASAIADQALSSLSTLGISVIALREAGVSGAYSVAICFIIWTILIGATRSLTSETFAVTHTQTDIEPGNLEKSILAHLAVPLALAAPAFTLALLATSFTATNVAVCVALFCYLIMDTVRATFQAAGKPTTSAVYSGILLITLTMGTVLGSQAGHLLLVIAIALAAITVAVVVWLAVNSSDFRVSVRPRFYSFLAEYAVTSGTFQGSLLIAGPLVSELAPIVNRLGTTAYGPYMVVFQATSLLAIPMLRRDMAAGRSWHPLRACAVISVCLTSVLALASVLLYIGSPWGEQVFADSWSLAAPLLPLFALSLIGGCVTAGPFLVLRALNARRASLVLRITSGVLQGSAPLAVGLYYGIEGYFIAMFCMSSIVGLLGLVLIHRKKGR